MRISNTASLLSGLVLLGCASAGPTAEEGPRVAVYEADDEKPCEYDVMHKISVDVSATRMGGQSRTEVRDRELGLVGAKVGADAVIIPDLGSTKIPFVVGSGGRAAGFIPPSTPAKFEGLAVRWIPETCKGLRPDV